MRLNSSEMECLKKKKEAGDFEDASRVSAEGKAQGCLCQGCQLAGQGRQEPHSTRR